MRFYLASGLENHARVREVAAVLKAMGHVQTYDWTAHGDVRRQGGEKLTQVACSESAAVMDAELVLLMLPGGRGTHSELGLAIASAECMREGEKRIWLWSESGDEFEPDSRTCAFYFHPRVRRFCGPFGGVLDAVGETFGKGDSL